MSDKHYDRIVCKQCKTEQYVRGTDLAKLKLCALCKRCPGRSPEEMAALRDWLEKWGTKHLQNKMAGAKHEIPPKPF